MNTPAHFETARTSTDPRNHIAKALRNRFGTPVSEMYLARMQKVTPLADAGFRESMQACQEVVATVIRKDPIYPWPGKTDSRPQRVRLKKAST